LHGLICGEIDAAPVGDSAFSATLAPFADASSNARSTTPVRNVKLLLLEEGGGPATFAQIKAVEG